MPNFLFPTMITDTKALFDSFYREGLFGNLVDKRTGLEILVLKEGLGTRPQYHFSLYIFKKIVHGQPNQDRDETAAG